MTEIKVGEYVRTKRGYIAKFKQYLENTGTYMFDNVIQDIDGDKYKCISENELKKVMLKHSKNIKDLVQAGDYVNGQEVIEVREQNGKIYLMTGYVPQRYIKDDIKLILTKEMYEQNLFKVVE